MGLAKRKSKFSEYLRPSFVSSPKFGPRLHLLSNDNAFLAGGGGGKDTYYYCLGHLFIPIIPAGPFIAVAPFRVYLRGWVFRSSYTAPRFLRRGGNILGWPGNKISQVKLRIGRFSFGSTHTFLGQILFLGEYLPIFILRALRGG